MINPQRIWIDPKDQSFWNNSGDVPGLIEFVRADLVSSAQPAMSIEEAAKAVYRKYGTNLTAFWRDAFAAEAQKHGADCERYNVDGNCPSYVDRRITTMPSNRNTHVNEWTIGFGEGVIEAGKILRPLVEQLCRDLNEAHNEILRQQGVAESEFNKFDWPEWTNQANSIRWAEKTLKKKFAKTDNWTLYPSNGKQAATFSTEAQNSFMYEDQLPADMPEEDYDRWYVQSYIYDGVRVGPIYPFVPQVAADDAEKEARERLQVFLTNDAYSLIAQHRSDTAKDRDITGDVEAALRLGP